MRDPEADRRARRLTRYLILLAAIDGAATALLARAAETELAWFTGIAGVVMLAGAVAASRAAEDEISRGEPPYRPMKWPPPPPLPDEVRATSDDDEIHP